MDYYFKILNHDIQINDECNESYSLKIITTWLNENNIKYTYNSQTKFSFCETKINVFLSNNITLTIETSPEILMSSCFSETSLIYNGKNELIQKHVNPNGLFYFITKIIFKYI
jgi:hypothetical protein